MRAPSCRGAAGRAGAAGPVAGCVRPPRRMRWPKPLVAALHRSPLPSRLVRPPDPPRSTRMSGPAQPAAGRSGGLAVSYPPRQARLPAKLGRAQGLFGSAGFPRATTSWERGLPCPRRAEGPPSFPRAGSPRSQETGGPGAPAIATRASYALTFPVVPSEAASWPTYPPSTGTAVSGSASRPARPTR